MKMTFIVQVFERLQKLNVTMSHSQLTRLVEEMGSNFDAVVIGWRDHLISKIKNTSRTQVFWTLLYANNSCMTA